MNHLLEIDSINKSFDGKKILTDIYIKCQTGEIIGLFGRNGSGKSTLLKIIYGVESAENKFIKVDNKVLKVGYHEKQAFAFLPQEKFIPKNLICKNLIAITINDNKIIEFCTDVNIERILNSKIGNLSGGELRYFSVKLILFSEAKFCLLDEPFSGISPIYCEKIIHLINEKSVEKGILISDHNYQYLLNIASKIFLLKDGFGRFLKNQNELVTNGYLSDGMI